MYLANKYAQNEEDSLYPSDPDKRALIDMRLCFDMSTLYVRFTAAYVSDYIMDFGFLELLEVDL